MTIFMEGGGTAEALRAQCRRGLADLLKAAGFEGRMPSVVACGARRFAFERFSHACGVNGGIFNILLVDSEAKMNGKPWEQLKKRDKWNRPAKATDDQVHLMVQCMETWLLSDSDGLKRYFGAGFNANKLPANTNLEAISKDELLEKLKSATKGTTTKGEYDKGSHSFDLLGRVDPTKLKKACPSAKRFFDVLDKKCRKA